MKLCKTCKGIGSVAADPQRPGNHKRCAACGGTGIERAGGTPALPGVTGGTPALPGETKTKEEE